MYYFQNIDSQRTKFMFAFAMIISYFKNWT